MHAPTVPTATAAAAAIGRYGPGRSSGLTSSAITVFTQPLVRRPGRTLSSLSGRLPST